MYNLAPLIILEFLVVVLIILVATSVSLWTDTRIMVCVEEGIYLKNCEYSFLYIGRRTSTVIWSFHWSCCLVHLVGLCSPQRPKCVSGIVIPSISFSDQDWQKVRHPPLSIPFVHSLPSVNSPPSASLPHTPADGKQIASLPMEMNPVIGLLQLSHISSPTLYRPSWLDSFLSSR